MRPHRLLRFAVAVAFILPANLSAPAFQRRGARPVRRETDFNAESPFRDKVKVPRYVMAQINATIDPDRFDSEGAREEVDGTLRGALVNLNDDGKDDLLVEGDSGANISGFWLFRNTGRRWELVLYTRTLGLFIERRRTNGFHDVSISAASAVTAFGATYKFDGRKYKPTGCYEQDIGTNTKKRYIRCGDDVKPYR